jgi:hypothetical protein
MSLFKTSGLVCLYQNVKRQGECQRFMNNSAQNLKENEVFSEIFATFVPKEK